MGQGVAVGQDSTGGAHPAARYRAAGTAHRPGVNSASRHGADTKVGLGEKGLAKMARGQHPPPSGQIQQGGRAENGQTSLPDRPRPATRR